MIRNMICKIFGHRWKYLPKPDILSDKRICKRCLRVEKRTHFTATLPIQERWIGMD